VFYIYMERLTEKLSPRRIPAAVDAGARSPA
jgi:hypothetical protein